MADFETPELKEYPVIPLIHEGVMAHSKPFVAKAEFQKPLGFPGELVENWQQVAIDKMGELPASTARLQVFLDSCVSAAPAPTSATTTSAPATRKTCRWRARTCMRKVYRRYFTFAGKYFPEAGRRGRSDQGGAGRLVQLFPPVLAVPPLFGVLPLRHRYRGNLHGRTRNHGQRRHGPEVLQRDHRQGLQDRQQPRPARAGAGRHPGRARRRHRGRHRCDGALPAGRERAPMSCWSRRPPTFLPNRMSTA